jgi:hypothetical protein
VRRDKQQHAGRKHDSAQSHANENGHAISALGRVCGFKLANSGGLLGA